MTRMNWDAVRAQRNAGPRRGNGGSLQRIRPVAEPVTATGCRRPVGGKNVEYGLSATWPDDICPVVHAFFRWGGGPWIPVEAAKSAVEECYDDTDMPLDQLEALSDEEWAAARTWRPRALPPQDDVPGLTWWVEAQAEGYSFEIRRHPKGTRRGMPVQVVRFVDEDTETWSELVEYATAVLAKAGTSTPTSRVGQFLRDNAGRPRWKAGSEPRNGGTEAGQVADAKQARTGDSRTPTTPAPTRSFAPSAINANDPRSPDGSGSGAPRTEPAASRPTEVPKDRGRVEEPPRAVGAQGADSPPVPVYIAPPASAAAGDLDDQLRRLRVLATIHVTGLLTPEETDYLKSRIIGPVQGPPPVPAAVTVRPEPNSANETRTCPACGYSKSRRTSNRCVQCRREFRDTDV